MMNLKKYAVMVIALSVFSSHLSFASPLKISDQKTEFFATGHPGLTIHGTTDQHTEEKPDDLQKEKESLSGKIKVDLKTFNTGMNLRDKHMRDKLFEVAKFPFAIVQIKALPIKEKNFKGLLTFHGIEKPVTGTQEIDASSYKIKLSINLTDYGITPPSFAGMEIDNLVQIEVIGHLQ